MKVLDRVNQHGVRNVVLEPVLAFLRAETASGPLLLVAALVALVWANSPASEVYQRLWETELTLGTGPLGVTEDLRHWVNDGLMTLFFFLVGLEIKRELITGELRDRRAAALPVLAATGGVLLPVAIFLAVVDATPARAGWGVPMATDIAFAVGVLAALGNRVPCGARVFLLSIAIVDDLIAIAVIAIFYSGTVQAWWLAAAATGLVAVLILRRLGVAETWPYLLVGLAVWYATRSSGVHATIAGVALALLTPTSRYRGREVLRMLERRLHPISAYLVVPVFALANAGVDLRGTMLADALASRLAWGVAMGLFAGKLLGITLVTLLAVRLRIGILPTGLTTRHVWGLAALAGIGFTVSLFIADLAYQDQALTDLAKIGVFAASLAGGALGATLLVLAGRNRGTTTHTEAPNGQDRPADGSDPAGSERGSQAARTHRSRPRSEQVPRGLRHQGAQERRAGRPPPRWRAATARRAPPR